MTNDVEKREYLLANGWSVKKEVSTGREIFSKPNWKPKYGNGNCYGTLHQAYKIQYALGGNNG